METMIDIEKMQKVNRLAQELLSHGMATDMDDAFRQADGLINKEQGTLQSPSKAPVSYGQQPQAPPSPQGEDGNWFFAMQRLTKQLELQARSIEELKATISSLQSDLLTVKNMQNMRGLQQQAPIAQTVASSLPQQTSVQQGSPVEQRAPEVKQSYNRPQLAAKGSGNPRCGVFTSNDVSIEKFFYSGPGGAKIR